MALEKPPISRGLVTTLIVVGIVALVLWIAVDLLPRGSQQATATVQDISQSVSEQSLSDKFINFIKGDSDVQATLATLGAGGNEQYSVIDLQTGDRQSGTVVITFSNENDGFTHEVDVFIEIVKGAYVKSGSYLLDRNKVRYFAE